MQIKISNISAKQNIWNKIDKMIQDEFPIDVTNEISLNRYMRNHKIDVYLSNDEYSDLADELLDTDEYLSLINNKLINYRNHLVNFRNSCDYVK